MCVCVSRRQSSWLKQGSGHYSEPALWCGTLMAGRCQQQKRTGPRTRSCSKESPGWCVLRKATEEQDCPCLQPGCRCQGVQLSVPQCLHLENGTQQPFQGSWLPRAETQLAVVRAACWQCLSPARCVLGTRWTVGPDGRTPPHLEVRGFYKPMVAVSLSFLPEGLLGMYPTVSCCANPSPEH